MSLSLHEVSIPMKYRTKPVNQKLLQISTLHERSLILMGLPEDLTFSHVGSQQVS